MSRLNESYPLVSDETAEVLVSSTIRALKYLSSTGDGELVFKLINALGFFNQKVVPGHVKQSDLDGIDVFTPILKNENLSSKIDVVAIFLAYFSIHRELHPLITESIESWHALLPNKDAVTALDARYTPGFYTLVSQLDQYEEVTPQLLQYLDLGLGHVLVNIWVPQWLQLAHAPVGKWPGSLEQENLTDLLLCEAKLDFHIATSTNLISLVKDKQQQKRYFIYKICKRISLFTDWIPNKLYRLAAQVATYHGSSASGLHFDLQVLMEIIDHPELNFFEEPRMSILLHQAANNLRKVPMHNLHAALGTLGTAQSLPAIVNMVQFLLCKCLINVGNVCEMIKKADYQLQLHPKEKKWFKAAQFNKYRIPSWFEESLLPPLPPITKSLFAFGNNEFESEQEANNFEMITNLLLESLDMIILINTEILKQYQWLKIDPLTIDGADETFNIRHRVADQYFKLFFIPIIVASMLSHQAADSVVGPLSTQGRRIMARIIFSNTTRLCKSLILAHGDIALYHFIKLCDRVSTVDILLQGICLDLLYHLFFGQDGAYIKQLCLENQLSAQTLQTYITVWNDGTDYYRPFFETIFETKQPFVPVNTLLMSKLYELLPNYEAICSSLQHKRAVTPRSSSFSSKEDSQQKSSHTPRLGKTLGSSPPLAYKYNPYSTPSFAPQRPLTFTPPVSFNPGNYTADNLGSTPDTVTFRNRSNDVMMGTITPAEGSGNYYSAFNSTGEPLSSLARTIESLNGTPQTPTSGTFSNPWDGSPGMNSTPSNSKIVSTGKNYILGGHNRVKNNSRAQSIHIDDFKSDL